MYAARTTVTHPWGTNQRQNIANQRLPKVDIHHKLHFLSFSLNWPEEGIFCQHRHLTFSGKSAIMGTFLCYVKKISDSWLLRDSFGKKLHFNLRLLELLRKNWGFYQFLAG